MRRTHGSPLCLKVCSSAVCKWSPSIPASAQGSLANSGWRLPALVCILKQHSLTCLQLFAKSGLSTRSSTPAAFTLSPLFCLKAPSFHIDTCVICMYKVYILKHDWLHVLWCHKYLHAIPNYFYEQRNSSHISISVGSSVLIHPCHQTWKRRWGYKRVLKDVVSYAGPSTLFSDRNCNKHTEGTASELQFPILIASVYYMFRQKT